MDVGNKVVRDVSTMESTDMDSSEFQTLVRQARESADLDSKLTVMQAVKKHKAAVFWALILSTSLVMEGYDLVIVSDATYLLDLYRQYCWHDILTSISDKLFLWPATIPEQIW